MRWFRIPSRTSQVRFSPRPSFSRRSTTRRLCTLCAKPPVSLQSSSSLRSPACQRGYALNHAQGQSPLSDPHSAAMHAQCFWQSAKPQACASAVSDNGRLRGNKHLCFVLHAAEGFTMDDTVSVTLKIRPNVAFFLRSFPAPRPAAFCCIFPKDFLLQFLLKPP